MITQSSRGYFLKLIRSKIYRCEPSFNFSRSFTSQNNGKDRGEGIDENHPIRRTFRILNNDINRTVNKVKDFFSTSKINEKESKLERELKEDFEQIEKPLKRNSLENQFQTHCDVLVIGGGGIGASTAYWLKKKARNGLSVVVVEKDPTYKQCSTVLSVGGLRQQFSLPENINMSLFGADFIRNSKEYLGEEFDLNFTPHGYLVLATERGAQQLKINSELQNKLGAKNELLSATQLQKKFPWLNTDGVVLGCHGLEKEGWFDPWSLLMGYKKNAREWGAHFTEGQVIGFEYKKQGDMSIVEGPSGQFDETVYNGLDKAIVQLPNGEVKTIKFALCVLAAGCHSGEVAKLAKIGTGPGMLSVPLPVEPRKRYVYVVQSQGENAPGFNTPLTIDPTFTYFRRDGLGGNYICGKSPEPENEPSIDNLEVDYEYFNTDVWPHLANRVPAFGSLKVVGAWSGFYEFNTFDENGIIGPHPYYHNLYIATGFSGHGIQQTPAVGRAISELIIDGMFREIDLTRLGFDRIIVQKPMLEINCV